MLISKSIGVPLLIRIQMNNNGVQPRNHHGFGHEGGGTALGGPSGNDEDGSFTSPYSADVHTHTNVNEYSKDDHSVKVKDTDVYPPHVHPGPALGPGAGPFPIKRGWPSYGGTAEGGPSGNDEGQTFNMPITGNFNTDVEESSEDDHSVDVKNKHIHSAPIIAPVHVHPPPHYEGRPAYVEEHHIHGPEHFGGPPPFVHVHDNNKNNNNNNDNDDFHIAAVDQHHDWQKRFGPEAGGTALGGPGGGGHGHDGFHGHSGGTALGGPSGDDDGINFGEPITADIHTKVNEYSKDDHSIDIKHKHVHSPAVLPYGSPYKREWGPKHGWGHEHGGTALGGPSGDDEGQTFNMPITVNTHTGIHEDSQDDHSVKVKNTHFSPGPYIPEGGHFRRAYSPDRMSGGGGGGTAEGGPSGDDEGTNFSSPTSVGVDTGVNEHHEDNHAVKIDNTHVDRPHYEAPEMPWMTYPEATTYEVPQDPPSPSNYEVHEQEPAPPSDREDHEDHEEVPQCHDEVHEVVRTVTKTDLKEVTSTETHTVYQQPATSVVVQTSSAPQGATPMQYPASKVYSSAVSSAQTAPASSSSSQIPYQSYNYNSQRPMSTTAAYSMIPVQVPKSTPSSSAMMSMATPSASHGMPSGVDPMHSASASASTSRGAMFTGAATRASGGIFSAIAAVAGVLAFVL